MFSDGAKRLDEILADMPAEGIEIRLHTDPPNDVPEGADWGPMPLAWAVAQVAHMTAWDAPSDRPRRFVGRPLRWLGAKLTDLGTRRAKLLDSWERTDG
jgi:hypothetical protein